MAVTNNPDVGNNFVVAGGDHGFPPAGTFVELGKFGAFERMEAMAPPSRHQLAGLRREEVDGYTVYVSKATDQPRFAQNAAGEWYKKIAAVPEF